VGMTSQAKVRSKRSDASLASLLHEPWSERPADGRATIGDRALPIDLDEIARLPLQRIGSHRTVRASQLDEAATGVCVEDVEARSDGPRISRR